MKWNPYEVAKDDGTDRMMTAELYVFLFAALGAYVIATVWHRTAEERRVQQLARAERERQASSRTSRRTNVLRPSEGIRE